MTHRLATFSIPLRDLHRLLGFPEDVRVVKVHSLPDQYAGEDGLRVLIESEAFPESEIGQEIPFAVPSYDERPNGSLKFKGFQLVRLVSEEQTHQVTVEDGI